jgi:hypothetical protein
MERINLRRQVYAKSAFDNVISTDFTQLTPVTPEVPQTQSIDINEFFVQYNNIFYDIPKFGETNSHEYLVKTSGQYINSTQTNETVEALIEEINQLRQENADLQNQQIQGDLTSVGQSIASAQQKLNK